MDRDTAIGEVFSAFHRIECEWGSGSREVAEREATEVLLALGVTPEELED